eukprot:332955-Prymnesium_polylepis.1
MWLRRSVSHSDTSQLVSSGGSVGASTDPVESRMIGGVSYEQGTLTLDEGHVAQQQKRLLKIVETGEAGALPLPLTLTRRRSRTRTRTLR